MKTAPESDGEALRKELRGWLESNLDERFRQAGSALTASAASLGVLREWNRRLAENAWVAIAWPREWGGRAASVAEQVAFAEEMDRAEAPSPVNLIGLSNIAPAILEHGTEAQRRRFLEPMRRGDEIWSQGFSEPEAGSDLASLRATAVRHGEGWLVNGQKTWNTLGLVADFCELLVRTDPNVPRHAGLTCLLVDLRLPGVEVRPIRTITGEVEFAEIFFTDVELPASAVLGEPGAGWRVAMPTLNSERGGVASLHLMVRRRIRRLIEATRLALDPDGSPRTADPCVRRALARLHVDGELLRALCERALAGMIANRPGPEAALTKLVWSRTEQRIAEVAAEVLGAEALGGEWARARLQARSYSIAGGTTQINKNLVARRVLGLPKGN